MFRLRFSVSVVLLLLMVSWARAADLPPRVVVLDELSPNLGIGAAVRDAYADEIAALPPEDQKAYLMDLVATLTTSSFAAARASSTPRRSCSSTSRTRCAFRSCQIR